MLLYQLLKSTPYLLPKRMIVSLDCGLGKTHNLLLIPEEFSSLLDLAKSEVQQEVIQVLDRL